MAKTLGDVMLAVAKLNDTKLHSSTEHQMYSLAIPYDDGRYQAVTAYVQADDDDENWLIVSSAFGHIDDLDPMDLLRRNESFAGIAFVGVEDDGSAVVLARIPLESADEDLVVRMVAAVAGYADALEESLLGGDAT